MRWLAAIVTLGLTLVGAPLPTAGQGQPDARLRLEHVAQTYRRLVAGHFRGQTTVTAAGLQVGEAPTPQRFSVSFAAGGRVRQDALGPAGVLIVSNGHTTWIHRADYQQYKELPTGGAFQLAQVDNLRLASERLVAAAVLGEETLEIGERRFRCTVLDAEYADDPSASSHRRRVRYWVDVEAPVVRQERARLVSVRGGEERESVATTVYSEVEIDPLFPDDHFTFVPGPRDVRVTEFANPEQADLTGQMAPLFELTALDGRATSLESLRGNVVILDFWATWCTPCIVEMPTLERLHTELRGRGVIVLGVNNEAPALARRFLTRHGVTFDTLTDPRGAVARLYGVRGIPVGVIIDRGGRVRAHFPGLRDERAWRVALAPVLAEP